VIAVALFMFLVTYLPHVLAERHTPPGHVYAGSVEASGDHSKYYSFIQQARGGRWVFENLLTSEPAPPALVNVQFLAVGWLGRISGWSDGRLDQVWRACSIALLLGAVWGVLGLVVRHAAVRRLALVAFATGGGFGWLFVVLRRFGITFQWDYYWASGGVRTTPYDLFTGTSTYHVVYSPFHATSYALFVLGVLLFLLAEARGARGLYLGSGVCGLALSSHPYEAVALLAALALYAVIARRDAQARRARRWRLVPIALTTVGLAYLAIVCVAFPVYRLGTLLPPVSPLHTLVGLGLAGGLAVAALPRVVADARTGDRTRLFLVSVLVAIIGVYYSYPLLDFTGALALILGMPVTALAAVWVDQRWPRWRGRRGVLVVVAVMLVVNALSSGVAYARRLRAILRPGSDAAFYLPAGLHAAAEWMRATAGPREIVLAPVAIAHRFAHGGNRVYAVSVGNTLDFATKAAVVQRFYAAATMDRRRWLDEHAIRYVVTDPPGEGFDPSAAPYLSRRFAANGYAIYEVIPRGNGAR
jgi:hypothetical protein